MKFSLKRARKERRLNVCEVSHTHTHTHVVVQAAQGLFDNPAAVMPDVVMGGGCWEIGSARTPCDFKILFGPLA